MTVHISALFDYLVSCLSNIYGHENHFAADLNIMGGSSLSIAMINNWFLSFQFIVRAQVIQIVLLYGIQLGPNTRNGP